jgi:predicted ATPase/class 3 adenylate cyclase
VTERLAVGRRDLPTGTVTFLRTDVEGSMGLARTLGPAWDEINASHLAILREAVSRHDGVSIRTEGDALFAVFPEAVAAVSAAVDIQRSLAAEPWPPDVTVRVRMGVHTGEAHRAGDDYGGFDVNRAARVATVGHGGQVILSETTAALVADALPAGTALRDLGRHVLKDVPRAERLSQLDIVGLPCDFPPLRTTAQRIGNLPDRLTSFVGRDNELAELVALAHDTRLVTLTGPGGIGKTSLAIETARSLAQEFRDGAWFVSLATVESPEQVRATIAHGIGIFDGPERSAASAVLSFLADQSMILILDNMEHLLAAADEVAAVVHASPASRVLVTSRAPLHIAGEHEVPVAPLVEDAVALFADRARAVRSGWVPAEDSEVVTEICHLLDNLPLGIELAAARVSTLPPTVIRDRLAARLPLPGVGRRDAPARQRTLEGAVSWSHDLLDPHNQELMHRLGVFEDGFDLEQVDAVAGLRSVGGDRLEDLLELADQSLIVAVPTIHGRARFRMLRTIQSFALDRLAAAGLEPDVRRHHAEAYLALVTRISHKLNTSRHGELLDRMAPERANLRSATRWSIDAGEGSLALRLVAALWRLWQAFGEVAEGRELAEEVLAMPEAPGSGSDRAWALSAAGSLAYWQADSAAARRHYEAQIVVAEAARDEACVADGYFNMGGVAFIEEDDEALQMAYVDDVVQRYRALGDERNAARAAWFRGVIALGNGHVEGAAESLRASLATFEHFDDRQYHAMTVASLAWAAFDSGQVQTASRLAVESLIESQSMRDLGTTTISLHIGVLLGAITGHFEQAAEIHGAFDALCQRYGVRPPTALIRYVALRDPFALTRQSLDPVVWAAAYERGRRLTLDEAVAIVVALDDAAGVLDGPETSALHPRSLHNSPGD